MNEPQRPCFTGPWQLRKWSSGRRDEYVWVRSYRATVKGGIRLDNHEWGVEKVLFGPVVRTDRWRRLPRPPGSC